MLWWPIYTTTYETVIFLTRPYLFLISHLIWLPCMHLGYDELERLLDETLVAFPDIKLHIVDSFCEGNDVDGLVSYFLFLIFLSFGE